MSALTENDVVVLAQAPPGFDVCAIGLDAEAARSRVIDPPVHRRKNRDFSGGGRFGLTSPICLHTVRRISFRAPNPSIFAHLGAHIFSQHDFIPRAESPQTSRFMKRRGQIVSVLTAAARRKSFAMLTD